MKRGSARPAAAKKGAGKATAKKKGGRPSTMTPAVLRKIYSELSAGTPLTVICSPDSMPGITTVWEWQRRHPDVSEAIARARESGFDVIATRLRETARERGDSTGDIARDKLIIETDLKLLAKWDPKRYGDKMQTEISGPDGRPIRSDHRISDELQEQILQRTAEAARIVAGVMPPASFRGVESES